MTITAEQKPVLTAYALLAASLLLSFVPVTAFAVLALLLFTAAFFAASRLRRKSAPDSFAAGHMTYLIRTIWLMSLLAAVTTGLASVYVLALYDPAPIHACADSLLSGAGNVDLRAGIEPCLDDFLAVNRSVFLIGGLMAGTPVAAYIAFRLFKGVGRALKNLPPADVKSWL